MRSVLLALKALPFASGKSARESQQRSFRSSSTGQMGGNFGLGALMNICKEINVEMEGNPPCPR